MYREREREREREPLSTPASPASRGPHVLMLYLVLTA